MKDMIEGARTFLILYHKKPFRWLYASDEEVTTELAKIWQTFIDYIVEKLTECNQ